ncbi:unnamed protein product [Prorocentrum cordatum]|uniref:Uncharacterized protein n=1 Tax=Prorocentrum cordatum TaxID=2364126 RepID=A0ABN9QZT3_9DINO|nr:unnamed protein product [Polarella glacialis]
MPMMPMPFSAAEAPSRPAFLELGAGTGEWALRQAATTEASWLSVAPPRPGRVHLGAGRARGPRQPLRHRRARRAGPPAAEARLAGRGLLPPPRAALAGLRRRRRRVAGTAHADHGVPVSGPRGARPQGGVRHRHRQPQLRRPARRARRQGGGVRGRQRGARGGRGRGRHAPRGGHREARTALGRRGRPPRYFLLRQVVEDRRGKVLKDFAYHLTVAQGKHNEYFKTEGHCHAFRLLDSKDRQIDGIDPKLEEYACLAKPQDAYGPGTLHAEEIVLTCAIGFGFASRIGRFHNTDSPNGTW